MRYSKAAHTRFYHRYHVVWVTKYRFKVLQGTMRERLREIIRQTCAELGVHIVRGEQVNAIAALDGRLNTDLVVNKEVLQP